MAEQVKYEIISPAKLEAEGQADMIIVPSVEGDLGLQAGRMPIMLMLRPAVVYIMNGNSVVDKVFVAGGYAQFENDVARILCEDCFSMKDITSEIANKKLSDAEKQFNEAEDGLEVESDKHGPGHDSGTGGSAIERTGGRERTPLAGETASVPMAAASPNSSIP